MLVDRSLNEGRWLSIPQAAAHISVKVCAVRKLIYDKKIKAVRGVGRGLIVDRKELDKYLERQAA